MIHNQSERSWIKLVLGKCDRVLGIGLFWKCDRYPRLLQASNPLLANELRGFVNSLVLLSGNEISMNRDECFAP